MQIEVTGQNVDVTPALHAYVTERAIGSSVTSIT